MLFVNNFCVSKLYTLKFLTLKKNYGYANICCIVFNTFSFRDQLCLKITVFTFQQFTPTYLLKLRSLNQNLQVWLFLGQNFTFRAAINISYKIAINNSTAYLFFIFNKFENLFYFHKIYWQKRYDWGFLMFLGIYLHNGKIRLKMGHFLLKIGFNKPRFCQNIDKFQF